ncbi:hypothetical protein GIB67_001637 [Kingdonia uniflora]|uniref:Uncharacterized protein n=1 Tax=Kingdonia uniflora TaxID=39325 RepID=A0A7J7L0X2_9MAGN|nr:hypothetical protein GIB67_001637 [Kingdonia uniflora]
MSIQGFYQGYKKTAHKRALSVDWKTAKEVVLNETVVVFRVDLVTAVRYKVVFWKSGHHKMSVGGNVSVDDQGNQSTKKGVKLSCAQQPYVYDKWVQHPQKLGWVGLGWVDSKPPEPTM